MRTPLKPLRVDLIVFYVCVIIAVFALGLEVGKAHAPEAKILHCTQKPSTMMYESRGDVKYWRAYTRSLPK
jgi:hypothetical protein